MDTATSRRADIDGLRAVAVAMVIGYHAHVGGFDGGFIGVDVFFVISGFLITGLLLDETARSGRVALAAFWGRRMRRLVPAAALMVVATLAAAALLLSPLELSGMAHEGGWAALYVSNIGFARQAGNYFAAGADASPFLHTWSLGVEEQFYVLWPLVVAAAAFVFHRRRRLTPIGLAVCFAAAGSVSFVLGLRLVDRGTPWAFYGLPTRVWEFAAGGLLACARPLAGRTRPAVRHVTALVGLGLLVVGLVNLSSLTPYPGTAALLPAVGTTALIAAGIGGGHLLGPILAWRPFQTIGALSYGWYLWHWPVIVLTLAVAQRDSVGLRLAASAGALAVAALTYRLVENPVRFHPWLTSSAMRSLVGGALVVGATFGITVATKAYADHELQSPFMRQIVAARSDTTPTDRCDGRAITEPVAACEFGPATATSTIVLIGDSHAAQWIPALADAADRLGVRLVVHTRGGCPALDIPIAISSTRLDRSGPCVAFRADSWRLLEALRPTGVIVAEAAYHGRLLDPGGHLVAGDAEGPAWRSASDAFVARLDRLGQPFTFLLDNPYQPRDPLVCAARKESFDRCASSLDTALAPVAVTRAAEQAAVAASSLGATFDTVPLVCNAATCRIAIPDPAVPGGSAVIVVYSDHSHVTATFARSVAPAFEPVITDLIGRAAQR